jgi:hypothetical protein
VGRLRLGRQLGHVVSATERQPREFLTLAVSAIAFAFVASAILIYGATLGVTLPDAHAYLAAGERLNAGHDLYALGPGDRTVALQGIYPLVSPPFIAVLWRPLAALGEWVLLPWSVCCAAGVAWTIWQGWRERPLVSALVSVPLWAAITFLILVGNVSGILMVLTIIAGRSRRWGPVLVGLMASIKIWPILLSLAVVRTRQDAAVLGLTLVGCAAVSFLGAGWNSHVAYLDVVRTAPPYDTSLASLSGVWWAGWGGIAVASIFALRGSYSAAVIASVIGNPALHLGAWATVLPALVRYERRSSMEVADVADSSPSSLGKDH